MLLSCWPTGTPMEPTDGTEVHEVLPAGQQKTKAAAALQEASQPATDHHDHSTWHADASQPAEPALSSKTLWALFAIG